MKLLPGDFDAQVERAREHLAGVALRTPLVRCPVDADGQSEVHLKLENLQPIGSFKLRGAGNLMAQLSESEWKDGVWTASAGNMAQGVAWCARRRGIPATAVAPDTAPLAKRRAIERLGARLVLVPFAEWWRVFETRSFPGMVGRFMHAFDDDHVMAGNGTIAAEIAEDLPEVAEVIVPWGGGGLACGIAAALRTRAPRARVWAAEVATAAPLAAALAAGEPRMVDYAPSFVDGIGSRTVFPRMLALAQGLLAGSITVSPEEAAGAIRLAAERNRVVLEGAAGCALAAALSGKAGAGPVVSIASGGNIDLDRLAGILAPAASRA